MSATASHLSREIREQPAVVARVIDECDQQIGWLAGMLRGPRQGCVLIAARGSSDNAARYAQYLFGARLGLPVALAAPSLESLHAAGAVPRGRGAVVIGISQSGRSPDVVSVLEAAKVAGTTAVAITNDDDSPLAHAAHSVIDLSAGVERSVAATKTYTASLAVLASLCVHLRSDRDDHRVLSRAPALIEHAVSEAWVAVDAIVDEVARAEHVLVIGRGYHFATAMEVALKIRELTGTVAEGYSAADLMHGPVQAVGPGTLAILVAPAGKGSGSVLEAGAALHRRRARTLLLSDQAGADLRIASGAPEWLGPLHAVAPGQVLAMRLAELTSEDVDRPAGLSKVTETR